MSPGNMLMIIGLGAFDAIRVAIVAYFISFIVSYGLSFLYSGKSNYAQILYREQKKIGKMYAIFTFGCMMVIYLLLPVVFVYIDESIGGIISKIIMYSANLWLLCYLYLYSFQSIHGSDFEKGLLSFIYTICTLMIMYLYNAM